MPRQLRIEMAGGFYHVMARGNRREAIFVDQSDRAQFLDLLGQVCRRHGWRVHAWVLLGAPDLGAPPVNSAEVSHTFN